MPQRPLPPTAYRDELAAAQTRVAMLEEQLAERASEDSRDDDPVIARLLEERRELDKTVSQRNRGRIVLMVLVGLLPMILPIGLALILDRVDHGHLAILMLGCAVLGSLLALGVDWIIRESTRLYLPRLDAKIAEARRLRAIERGLRARVAGEAEAPRVRVDVESEPDENERDEEDEGRARRTRRAP